MNNQDIVTLAKYASIEEAQVIKGLLDSVGIENQILNETAAQVMPYLEGDVRIVVNASDYEKAKEALKAGFDKNEMK